MTQPMHALEESDDDSSRWLQHGTPYEDITALCLQGDASRSILRTFGHLDPIPIHVTVSEYVGVLFFVSFYLPLHAE